MIEVFFTLVLLALALGYGAEVLVALLKRMYRS
jgi:hypothetical protein